MASFQVFYDLPDQFVRLRQVAKIGQALVLKPEDVRAGFVSRDNLVVAELTPAAAGTS